MMPNTTFTHPLSGAWDFRFDGEAEWRRIDVPGCWETPDGSKDSAGPAWYRTQIAIPPEAEGRRVALAFGAVSYACTVFIDGKLVGEHTGLWDAFTIDLTSAVQPGTQAELTVQVEKPAALTAGPDSASLPGRFPLRTTLSGFLPYVWGQIFGGIWQDVKLIVAGPTIIEDLFVRGSQDGRVTVELAANGPPTSFTIEITGPEGALLVSEVLAASDPRWSPSVSTDRRECTLQCTLPAPRPWSPADPVLYSLVARLEAGD
jgi:beta-galactosidase/beta-glucuronidase